MNRGAPGTRLRVVLFCHSLVSDWNHGNAHFLRGVVRELRERGAEVRVFEPEDGWSRRNLIEERGDEPLRAFERAFPTLASETYHADVLDLHEALDGADLVVVHEWTDPGLVARIGRHRDQRGRYRLLYFDTHHRAVSAPEQVAALDLSGFDGVLAFGAVLRDLYLERGWARRAWTWHEAADVRIFRPHPELPRRHDLVWVGNWGDEERTAELGTYLLEPVVALGLDAVVHGVRYPAEARRALAAAGVRSRGYLANHLVPRAFARARVTVHVPRRPYAEELPGVPTIRVFEALACGMPLVCSPWRDVEGLFSVGHDFLMAEDGAEMREHLRAVLHDDALAAALSLRGRRTVLERHTCAHRVDELLGIAREIGVPAAAVATVARRSAAERGARSSAAREHAAPRSGAGTAGLAAPANEAGQ